MRVFTSTILSLLFAGVALAADKPSLVVFLADDHGWLDSSVYGNPAVRTPTMKKLAAEGMTFTRAFVASPACGPSRASLLSGLMPARHGAEPNHTQPRLETLTMVKALKAQGYEVAAFGKVGHGTAYLDAAGFDTWKDGRKEQLGVLVRNFLAQRSKDKPLCLFVGDHRPHVQWSQETTYTPDEVPLPKYFIDTPETREHWARYLTDVTGMDALMGQVDQMARDHLGSDDYLFLYTSDHGGQWPFAKWNLYDVGTRTPLLVRWPGHIQAGTRTDAMVSWVDILPTLVTIADGSVPDNIDGRSFADVLFGRSDTHREVIFTTHSGDGNRNVYPIRAVRTAQFKYIRNLRPDCQHSNHSDIDRKDGAGAYWDSWDAAAARDPRAAAIVAKYYVRPAVEFYDLEQDPTEQRNLAEDPKYQDQIASMSSMLDDWIKQQGDTLQTFREPYPADGPRPREVIREQEARADGVNRPRRARPNSANATE